MIGVGSAAVTADGNGDVAGRPDGPDLPLGRRIELPGRGTTFVREVDGPAGRADRAPAPRPGGQRRPQLVPGLRAAGRALPGARPRPPRPRSRAAHPRAASAWPTAPTTPPPCSTCSAPARSSRSATRWAGRSPSCSGSATPRRSPAWCSCATSDRFVPVQPRAARLRHRDVGRHRHLALRPACSPGCRAVPCAAPGRQPAAARRGPTACGPGRRPRCAATTGAWWPRRPAPSASTTPARWIGDIDVPTTVLVTTEDKAISPLEQMRLLLSIPERRAAAHRRRAHRVRPRPLRSAAGRGVPVRGVPHRPDRAPLCGGCTDFLTDRQIWESDGRYTLPARPPRGPMKRTVAVLLCLLFVAACGSRVDTSATAPVATDGGRRRRRDGGRPAVAAGAPRPPRTARRSAPSTTPARPRRPRASCRPTRPASPTPRSASASSPTARTTSSRCRRSASRRRPRPSSTSATTAAASTVASSCSRSTTRRSSGPRR